MIRRATALLVLIMALPATAAAAPPRAWVGGGPAIDIREAPWQVSITTRAGDSAEACGGSLVSVDRVITAAHCVDDDAGRPVDPRAVEIRAGDSHRALPDARGEVQRRGVALVRIHPNRNLADDPYARDIAVLHLARPVDVTPTVNAVALPAAGTLPAEGQGGRLAGFGRQTPEASASGQLHAFDATVGSPMCAGAANAVLFCASSPVSSTCSGDSGSGFVVFTPSPVLAGVAIAGPASCGPGTPRVMSKVAPPEILGFIYGDPAPAPAPRALGGAQLRVPRMREGHVAQCLSPSWSPSASLVFTFFDASGRPLASGPSPT